MALRMHHGPGTSEDEENSLARKPPRKSTKKGASSTQQKATWKGKREARYLGLPDIAQSELCMTENRRSHACSGALISKKEGKKRGPEVKQEME